MKGESSLLKHRQTGGMPDKSKAHLYTFISEKCFSSLITEQLIVILILCYYTACSVTLLDNDDDDDHHHHHHHHLYFHKSSTVQDVEKSIQIQNKQYRVQCQYSYRGR
jgi:hypothetical protein